MTEAGQSAPRRLVSLKELEPLIREAFAAGKAFGLPVTGTSNLPTLSPNRDSILLGRADGPLKKGDLPLYRRSSGQYVLHRVVSVQKDGSYTCCGDNQCTLEPGIRPEQIIGKTVWIRRKGREFSPRHLGYRLWVWFWVLVLPRREALFRVRHAAGRLCRKLFPGKFKDHT